MSVFHDRFVLSLNVKTEIQKVSKFFISFSFFVTPHMTSVKGRSLLKWTVYDKRQYWPVQCSPHEGAVKQLHESIAPQLF